ncbi:MAG: aminotransferase class V-fold PLP-dependent enzyme [Candidatus Methanomethylophilaceae archaeon]|nr:aminotransferase class V-fold PLP-dependent enzyme [Candidatus Methanomethylophilaceae archaeon]
MQKEVEHMENIYLDNAATTPLRKEALDAMMPYLTGEYANPSSIHPMARTPKDAVKHAREQIANVLNADPSEIFFTPDFDRAAVFLGQCRSERNDEKVS